MRPPHPSRSCSTTSMGKFQAIRLAVSGPPNLIFVFLVFEPDSRCFLVTVGRTDHSRILHY